MGRDSNAIGRRVWEYKQSAERIENTSFHEGCLNAGWEDNRLSADAMNTTLIPDEGRKHQTKKAWQDKETGISPVN